MLYAKNTKADYKNNKPPQIISIKPDEYMTLQDLIETLETIAKSDVSLLNARVRFEWNRDKSCRN